MRKKRKFKTKNILAFISLIFVITVEICVLNNRDNDNKDEFVNKTNKEKGEVKNEQVGSVPTIKLNGIEEMKIVKNGVYDDLGATAQDEEDGDLTSKIKVDNKVKYDTPGDYEIIYSVEDKDNNKVEKIRKIKIFEVKEEEKDTDGISVLMYHYFYDDINGETGKDANYMAKSLFEEQLKYLSENNYYIPTMKEIKLYLDGKLDLPKKSVVLTLDDGEESNYRIAYPLAVKYKIPLVMFVVTTWTDVSESLQKEMKNTGYIRFHSHTDDMHEGGCNEQHGARILCINHDLGVKDLKTSGEKLGNFDALAYPCGDTNESAISIVKESGISLAFTVEYGRVKRGQNYYALPRVRMNDGISLSYFIDSL